MIYVVVVVHHAGVEILHLQSLVECQDDGCSTVVILRGEGVVTRLGGEDDALSSQC